MRKKEAKRMQNNETSKKSIQYMLEVHSRYNDAFKVLSGRYAVCTLHCVVHRVHIFSGRNRFETDPTLVLCICTSIPYLYMYMNVWVRIRYFFFFLFAVFLFVFFSSRTVFFDKTASCYICDTFRWCCWCCCSVAVIVTPPSALALSPNC